MPLERLEATLLRRSHASGIVHHHLHTETGDCAAALVLRTPARDDTGRSHALEHLVLCGSARFPVRDPLQGMLGRSLQSECNAWTGPDATTYLCASPLADDLCNMVRVLADAVWNPLLEQTAFDREVWHLSAEGQLGGVVFNEMAGAMAEPDEVISAAVGAALYPRSPFAWNEGGDPLAIPKLSLAAVRRDHQAWYRPANLCLVSVGPIDPATMEAEVLSTLPRRNGAGPQAAEPGTINGQRRIALTTPPRGADPREASAWLLAWPWGDMRRAEDLCAGRLLNHLLCGHDATPLRLACDESGIGLGDGSGFGSHAPRGELQIRRNGCQAHEADTMRTIVHQVLAQMAATAPRAATLDAAFLQLEMDVRRLSGDPTQAASWCHCIAEAWTDGTDPVPFLDPDPVLTALRERCTPAWAQAACAELIAPNRAMIDVQASPDSAWPAAQQQRLKRIAATSATKVDWTQREQQRRSSEQREDDPSCLPSIGRGDIPPAFVPTPAPSQHEGISGYAVPSGGLIQQVAMIPLPAPGTGKPAALTAFTAVFGALGRGALGYQAHTRQLDARCSGIAAWSEARCDPGSANRLRGALVLSCEGPAHSWRRHLGLLPQCWYQQVWHERERIAELLLDELDACCADILESGDDFAHHCAAAACGGTPAAALAGGGLEYLHWLRWADTHLDEAIAEMAAWHRRLLRQKPRVALIGSPQTAAMARYCRKAWGTSSCRPIAGHHIAGYRRRPLRPQALITDTGLGYAAAVYPGPALGADDCPALAIGCQALSDGALHSAVRERGGAYGVSFAVHPRSAQVVFTSYRDPKPERSLAACQRLAQGLAQRALSAAQHEAAVLALIAGLDTRQTPPQEALDSFIGTTLGRGDQHLQRYRAAILATTPQQVRAAAQRYLARTPSCAILAAQAPKQGNWRHRSW
ncbi:MAG: insulinase family protein [Planctomycetota bacterium]|nr:insulinase family protein [Planctomycetota bacterium]